MVTQGSDLLAHAAQRGVMVVESSTMVPLQWLRSGAAADSAAAGDADDVVLEVCAGGRGERVRVA